MHTTSYLLPQLQPSPSAASACAANVNANAILSYGEAYLLQVYHDASLVSPQTSLVPLPHFEIMEILESCMDYGLHPNACAGRCLRITSGLLHMDAVLLTIMPDLIIVYPLRLGVWVSACSYFLPHEVPFLNSTAGCISQVVRRNQAVKAE